MDLRSFLILYALSFSIATPIDPNGTQPEVDAKQSKRGLSEVSYSYAATDIGAKGGTRIKTITILKNYKDSQKEKSLKINPEVHKDEEWGSKFRDNFDSFGKIPDVPEIENLALIKEEPKTQNLRQEIPIYEMFKDKNDKLNLDKEELTDEDAKKENQNEESNKEIVGDVDQGRMTISNSKEVPEDVELIEEDSSNVKLDKSGLKSQPLIAFSSLRNGKQQRQTPSVSTSLHTHPYHLLLQTKNSNSKSSNQKQFSDKAGGFSPYKLSELYKMPYSPLLFPPIQIPVIKNNDHPVLSEISSTTPFLARAQIAITSTQQPYIAPYKARNTSSSPIPNKASRNAGTRSRGLKYK